MDLFPSRQVIYHTPLSFDEVTQRMVALENRLQEGASLFYQPARYKLQLHSQGFELERLKKRGKGGAGSIVKGVGFYQANKGGGTDLILTLTPKNVTFIYVMMGILALLTFPLGPILAGIILYAQKNAMSKEIQRIFDDLQVQLEVTPIEMTDQDNYKFLSS